MPCCLILVLLLAGPRVVIVLAALFTTYLERPFDGLLVPVLGFIFLPWTTLAYAWAINTSGQVAGLQLAVVILAFVVDVGLVGGAAERKQRQSR